MTKLPPLPLIDGAFLIDNSSLTLMKCPRLYEYQALRRRVLADAKAGRNFGSGLHVGWAVRYRRCGNRPVDPESVLEINEVMRSWFLEHPQPPGDFRTYDHAVRVMDAYNRHYQREPFEIMPNPKDGKPVVEASFCLPLGELQTIPIYLTGKIDLMVRDHSGIWAGPDHKSTFMFGDSFDYSMQTDPGQLGYTWAASQVLQTPVRGYIIDAIRIRRPKRSEEALDTAPVDYSDFKRIPYDVTPDNIEEWKYNTLKKIQALFFFHDDDYFPKYEWNCVNKFGKCDMFDVCTVARNSRESVLNSTLFEENTWSPLNLPPGGAAT